MATASNPLDTVDYSLVAALKEKNPYGILAGIMEEDDNIDMVAIIGPGEVNPKAFTDVLLDIHKKGHRKPYVVVWPSASKEVDECKKVLNEAGVPLILTPECAGKALGAMIKYKRLIKKLEGGRTDGEP